MPYSTIDSPKKYFEAKTYTGTGSTQSISGLSFSPDFVWIKNRSGANSHGLVTSLVNTRYALDTSATSGEVDFGTTGVTSLNSDGFTVVSHPVFNSNTNNYISWCWDANGTGVSNTAGTISSTVSANTTSGFSIVSYTGTGANATVGHGLGVAPKMIIIKSRGTAGTNWQVGHQSLSSTPWNSCVRLNSTIAIQTASTLWNNTAPTSSVFTIGSDADPNTNGSAYIAFCWSEVKGFSKFGSYTGNGGTGDNGVFVYTGFKPAFVMFRATNYGTVTRWIIKDNKRNTYNVVANNLSAELAGTENTDGNDYVDFLSNGFKYRGTTISENINASGTNYIYMAFAENPFVSSKGIPTTAR